MRGPSQGRRLAIAFFPGNSTAADVAFSTLRRLRLSTKRLSEAESDSPGRGSYAHLSLPDESILVAWIDVADLAAAIDVLQAAGARSIFLTPGGMPAPEQENCVRLGGGFVRTNDIQKSINELQRLVQGARNYLVESVRLGHLASPAAQWVIDNAYLISLNLSELRKELPTAFRKMSLARAEEILELAHKMVAETGSRLTETALLDFLDNAQVGNELDSPRLWSFPLLIRVALIEQLAALACRSSRVQQLREAAFLWADRLAVSSGHPDGLLHQMVERLSAEPFASDRTFAVALAEQLQDQEVALEVVHAWIASHLDTPLGDLVRAEHEREAADSLLASNAFNSLKVISHIDFRTVFESVSRAEAVLREDPSKIYPRSDFATRDQGRQIVARIAWQAGKQESDVAREALRLATEADAVPMNDVLYYLISDGVPVLERAVGAHISLRQRILRGLRRHSTGVYIGSIFFLTACFLAISLSLAFDAGMRSVFLLTVLGGLAALPLSELAIQMVHSLLIEMFPPEPLPRMDFKFGIPEDAATLIVVPMMLSSVETTRREAEKLEIRYLANRHKNLTFALFPDFLDAPESTASTDSLLLSTARACIVDLNRRYPHGRFVLFHRQRLWSETQQLWIGRERKRGKIEELNALICGHGDPALVLEGTLSAGINFVITLDADTHLPPNVAMRLIETIAHPLNRVRINAETGIRERGYGIIQPRVGITLPGASATRFTRVFADAHGTDPYSTVVSDAQQDLFGEGIFHGKAIFDVHAFDQILGDRFPSETLLSHDLIEGAHAGVGFSSDIELLENLPLDYPGYAKRQHRWIRGDWQIAQWAGSKVPNAKGEMVLNPLSAINRWRVFDNLRRSFVPIASVLLVVFGWFFSVAPGVWSLVLALTVGIPAIVPILDRWTRHIEGSVYGWQGAADDLRRAATMLTVLPHQAWISMDAIIRVLHRRFISKRQMLEWQTADAAESNKGVHLEVAMRQLIVIASVSAVALMILAVKGAFAPTFVYLGVWIAAPWVIRWLAGATPSSSSVQLDNDERPALRALARRTWRYFDDLVGQTSNWLPPDNSQLALRTEVARRTSPTNIGLWFNAAQAAHDFGYITTADFVERSSATMATLDKLQRYEGHLLNWYDTDSLEPLLPPYVSTVDSGNLIASLWVFAHGCNDLIEEPVLTPAALAGLADAVEVLGVAAGNDPSVAVALQGLSQTLRRPFDGAERIGQLRLVSYHSAQLKEMRRWSTGFGDETTYWALKVASELDSWTATLDRYLSWMELLSGPSDEIVRSLGEAVVDLRRQILKSVPSLKEMAEGPSKPLAALFGWRGSPEARPEVADWLNSVYAEYRKAQEHARDLMGRLQSLAAKADNLATAINMGFLYDPARRLFGIGYAIGNPMTFNSHYDLLASECRVASLVSIAKGDIPIEHWFMLARPRAAGATGGPLLSWSGTMFEYLMPLLFSEAFGNTLLAMSCRAAVDAQISFADRENIPWGISEAAYSALDSNQIYQYRAFGVPSLALNPNVDPGPVVAPYATVLALMVRPQPACENLRRLEAAGLSGSMGFYEAIDYTRPRRKGDDKPGVPIFSYMAHHQGMSLLALSNVLSGGIVRRRFHADLRIRAIESLLFERVPIARVETEDVARPPIVAETSSVQERRWNKPTLLPRVLLSSNGRYNLMVTNNGGGYSQWKGFDITRWRSDTALDSWGSFVWIKDLRSGQVWSPCRQPMGEPAIASNGMGESVVSFSPDRAEFVRRVQDIEAKLEVAVATDDDAELRRLTITNRSTRSRSVELTSYLELALAPHGADIAHPVFSKMFIETEHVEENVLIAHRRLRSPDDTPIWAAAMLTGFEGLVGFETDRRAFVGRGNNLRSPAALAGKLGGTTGSTLDPIFSFRHRVTLEPRNQRTLCLITIAASNREDLLNTIRKYQRPDAAAHAFEMIWTRAQLEFRYLRIGPAAAHRYQDLAGHLIYPASRLRPRPDGLAKNRLGQSSLWRFGISGDRPILVVTVADDQAVGLVREVLLAHSYWHMLGLESDLVILNREGTSYDAPLQKSLDRLIHAHGKPQGPDKPESVFLVDWQSLSLEDQGLLLSVARVVLGGHRGPLQQQLLTLTESQEAPALPPSLAIAEGPVPELTPRWASEQLVHRNGLGGFSTNGREYLVELTEDARTPVPWANVMANERFGTLVTESGLGFTWNGNSQMNRLTPWHNDPVSDPQSEVIYLRDDETGAISTPTPLPIRERQPYRVRHGQGYSVYEHHSLGLRQRLTVFAASQQPVKICILSLKDDSGRARKITATYLVEWVLGSVREQQQSNVSTSYDAKSGGVFARQAFSEAFAAQVAFAATAPKASSYCGDRVAFYGAAGSAEQPASLTKERLDNYCGAGLDPCAALQVNIDLSASGNIELVFLLGEADTEEAAALIIAQFGDVAAAHKELDAVTSAWNQRLEVVQVETPSPAANFLLNRWLLYQTLSCRIWGRSGFYQSGGAVGFRDQLQDCLAAIYFDPGLTRAHILRAAGRQFPEGDVQHWWHPKSGLGVRTRCSDDLLWLPWVVARYIEITQDAAILDESVGFIEGALLPEHESEMMYAPTVSAATAPLWDHCRRAIEKGNTKGAHGLPLMGNGDWNDGMNRVGIEGRGESVWLAWFLIDILNKWSALMETRDSSLSESWRARSAELAGDLEQNTWDGEWYLRGYFDDGSPLGSHNDTEAQIDSLPQSWSVLSGAAPAARSAEAMKSAKDHLLRKGDGLVLLFTPPFDKHSPHPGYIMGYPPGTRENGGQYTHGSLWLAQAMARRGDGAGAVELLETLSPVERTATPSLVAKYHGEPYVVAADVSSSPGRAGAAGWTWYTGSAGWMYRVWLEDVLGFHLRGTELSIRPAIPAEWAGFRLTYRFGASVWKIQIHNESSNAEAMVECDGRKLGMDPIQLVDDEREHNVQIWLAAAVQKSAVAEQLLETV